MEIGGKKSLYGNVRNCTEIGKKTPTLYGNVRKSDLVEIWPELASQLDLNCSENVKKYYCKKLLVELTYKTRDNLMPNYIFWALQNDAPQIFLRLHEFLFAAIFSCSASK